MVSKLVSIYFDHTRLGQTVKTSGIKFQTGIQRYPQS